MTNNKVDMLDIYRLALNNKDITKPQEEFVLKQISIINKKKTFIRVISTNKYDDKFYSNVTEASNAINVSRQAITYSIKNNKPRYVRRSDKKVFYFYKVNAEEKAKIKRYNFHIREKWGKYI